MKVIRPSSTTLVSTSVAASTLDEYEPGTTYAKGAHVVVPADNREYESMADGNLGNAPATNPDKWLDLGATNQYRMFDEFVNTRTTDTDEIEVVVSVSRIDHVVLLGVDAATVTLTLLSADGLTELWSETVDVLYDDPNIAGIADWREYFFGPDPILGVDLYREIGVLEYDARLRVTVSYTDNTAAIGGLIVGSAVDLGMTLYGAQAGILDYSKKTTDDYGRTTLTQGEYAKRASLQVYVESGRTDAVHRTLANLRGTACAWLGDNDAGIGALILYGFYRDFGVVFETHNRSLCRLEIEGLT